MVDRTWTVYRIPQLFFPNRPAEDHILIGHWVHDRLNDSTSIPRFLVADILTSAKSFPERLDELKSLFNLRNTITTGQKDRESVRIRLKPYYLAKDVTSLVSFEANGKMRGVLASLPHEYEGVEFVPRDPRLPKRVVGKDQDLRKMVATIRQFF